jgi:hypothetical protein
LQKANSAGSEIFWEFFSAVAGWLALSAADLALFTLAFVFVAIGAIRLHKNRKPAGTGYLLASVAGYFIGFLAYGSYLLLLEDEVDTVEKFASFYMSACSVVGGYGFLRLCGSLNEPKNIAGGRNGCATGLISLSSRFIPS